MKNIPFYILGLLSLIIIGYVFFTKVFHESRFELKKTDTELLESIQKEEHLITPEELAGMLNNAPKDFVLVDIRSPQNYNVSKIEMATNIPFQKMLDKEWKKFFEDSSLMKVLYCDLDIYSIEAWMLLHQMGYGNIYVLEGGMNFWKKYMIDGYSPKSGGAHDETPLYDYARVMKEAGAGGNNQNTTKNTPTINVPVKKKKSVEGGCG